VAGLVAMGFGQGLAYNVSTTAAMEAATESEAGVASGTLTTIRSVGLVAGVTLSSNVARTAMRSDLDSEARAAGLDGRDIGLVEALLRLVGRAVRRRPWRESRAVCAYSL
jgi:hypothetical protein